MVQLTCYMYPFFLYIHVAVYDRAHVVGGTNIFEVRFPVLLDGGFPRGLISLF